MSEYRNPVPTVDVIVEMDDRPGQVLLIRRRNPPEGWALPGGFVDEGEPLWAAARREAMEETDLSIELEEQFFAYSDPRRDPRRHTITTVFIAAASGQPRAGDDAAQVAFFNEDDLPELAFDHSQILEDYFLYRRTGTRPPPDR